MEVRKCLEYYFQGDTPLETIMGHLDKNINELKRISKIRNTKIEIEPNEYGVKVARLQLIINEKNSRKPKKVQLKKIKIEKEKKIKTVKIKKEKPIKTYGVYKEGGTFKPY